MVKATVRGDGDTLRDSADVLAVFLRKDRKVEDGRDTRPDSFFNSTRGSQRSE